MTRIRRESELHFSHPCYPRNPWFNRIFMVLVAANAASVVHLIVYLWQYFFASFASTTLHPD